MCTWIDENQSMNVLRCCFGCAMFKRTRDVCTSVVPKGYLSLGGIWGLVSKPAPNGYTRWKSSTPCVCGTHASMRGVRLENWEIAPGTLFDGSGGACRAKNFNGTRVSVVTYSNLTTLNCC